MFFTKKEASRHYVTVVADTSSVDDSVAQIEEAVQKMEQARLSLIKTIADSKRAKSELESIMGRANKLRS